MRLKYIETCSFHKSEMTNFFELSKKNRWKLSAGEVVLLISKGGDQLVFIYAADEAIKDGVERPLKLLRSERLRLTHGGTWDPIMLSEYAEEAGIKLDGIHRFDDYYKALT